MRSVFVCLFVVLSLVISGCGGAKPDTAPPPGTEDKPLGSTAELKKMLEEIANTGVAGSATAGLRPTIEELQKTDPAKGAALLKDLGQLEGAEGEAQVKAIAKRMASQL
jgi:hypothetical protein